VRSVYCAIDDKETFISQRISIVVSPGVRALGRSRGFVRYGSMWRESAEKCTKRLDYDVLVALSRVYSIIVHIGTKTVLRWRMVTFLESKFFRSFPIENI
jgi:hypothetical protein